MLALIMKIMPPPWIWRDAGRRSTPAANRPNRHWRWRCCAMGEDEAMASLDAVRGAARAKDKQQGFRHGGLAVESDGRQRRRYG